MHYVTHRSHWMQKYKFGVTCPDALSWDPHYAHPSMKNSVSVSYATHTPERTMWPKDPTGYKNKVWHNVSRCAFYGI
jgi:hypothetical protein